MKIISLLSLLLLTSCQMGTETSIRNSKYAWTDVQEAGIMTRFENIEVVCYSFDKRTLSCFPKP